MLMFSPKSSASQVLKDHQDKLSREVIFCCYAIELIHFVQHNKKHLPLFFKNTDPKIFSQVACIQLKC